MPLRLDDAWIPHGRFRGEGHIPLETTIWPGESARVQLSVTAAEPPGTQVNNAFLILRTPEVRIFTRMRIEFDQAATPTPIIESVTTQSLQ